MTTTPALRINIPGIYSLSAAQYHADPCVVPSFSRSIAKLLCKLSPAHARHAHPRLGIGREDEDISELVVAEAHEDRDVGTAAHAIFLRGDNVVEKVPFDTYQTKAARGLRDEILAAGKVPLKQTKYDEVMGLVEALERYRARTGAFTKGKPEQTLIWRDGDIWCRCMVDWLYDDPAMPIDDLKTTSGRAIARTWSRNCFDSGNDLQAVFYPAGAAEVRDGEAPAGMRFHVAETKPPYGIKRFELTPAALSIAAEKLNYARNLWAHCMRENAWPTYSDDVEYIDAPPWELREWDWNQRTAVPSLQSYGERRDRQAEVVDRMIRTGNLAG